MVDARGSSTRRSDADPPVSTSTSCPNCCLAMPAMAGEGARSSALGPHRTFHDRQSTNRSTNCRRPMPRLPDSAPAPPAATQHAAHARVSPPTTDQKVRGVRDLRARLISGWVWPGPNHTGIADGVCSDGRTVELPTIIKLNLVYTPQAPTVSAS